MPSLSQYKNNLGAAKYCGQARKRESDMIEESTFMEDINYRVAYFYDYYTDDEPTVYTDLHPQNCETKTPIDIKFIALGKNSENKDQIGYAIQFRPSFNWKNINSLSWYKDRFVDRFQAQWPNAVYVDIPDESGIYRKWLVTEEIGWLNTQFPTWYVLPVDHIFQWVKNNTLYQMAGVYRSQSSYNSGVYTERVITHVENQLKCILPMNEVTTTLFYNDRIVLGAHIPTPVVWIVSKVEQSAPKGVDRVTFYQKEWDANKDAFEYEVVNTDGTISSEFTNKYDASRKCLGIWADYYSSAIAPTKTEDEPVAPSNIHTIISYAGVKPEMRLGGNNKKFTVEYFDGENPSIYQSGTWSVESSSIKMKDVTYSIADFVQITTKNENPKLLENEVYIKVLDNVVKNGESISSDQFIGKTCIVKFVCNNDISIYSEIEMELKS